MLIPNGKGYRKRVLVLTSPADFVPHFAKI